MMKIKRLNDLAKIPTRADSGAAGWDLYAATDYDIKIEPHKTVKIGLGFATDFPEGIYAGIYARSGIATKRSLRPENVPGVIDSSYRGEWIVALHNDSDEIQTVEAGERIAQCIFHMYIVPHIEEVNELSETERGEGGFGSSGRK